MAAYKGRRPDPSKRVEVYRNLNNGMWSVRQEGKIIFHCNRLVLRDARYRVQDAGRERVRKEGRKNVHAYISGYLSNVRGYHRETKDLPKDKDGCLRDARVSYNPYTDEHFMCPTRDGKNRMLIWSSDWCDLWIDDQQTNVLAIWEELYG